MFTCKSKIKDIRQLINKIKIYNSLMKINNWKRFNVWSIQVLHSSSEFNLEIVTIISGILKFKMEHTLILIPCVTWGLFY